MVDTDHAGDGSYDQRVSNAITVNAAGAVTTNATTLNADGTLRSTSANTVSADGLTRTSSFDVNGDGATDLSTSDVTMVAASGSRVQTVEQRSGNGALLAKSVTSTSADRKSVTIATDANGDGHTDSITTKTTAADGTTTQTNQTFDAHGLLETKTLTVTSADGGAKTTKADIDGDGVFDRTASDVKVLRADGSSQVTVLEFSANNTLIRGSVTTTSADGNTRRIEQDINGDNLVDAVSLTTIVLASDGSRTETATASSRSGALLSKSVTTVSADRKTATATTDANGDGRTDQIVTTQIAANGSQSATTKLLNPDGTVARQSTATASGNGLSRSETFDFNNDGVLDRRSTDVIVFNADGSTTQTKSELSGSGGTLLSRTSVTVSGNQLSKTSQTDYNGDGVYDERIAETTVINANGSVTTTTTDTMGASTLVGKSISTTSANGLSASVDIDKDGNGTVDITTSKVSTIYATGATGEAVSVKAGNGALISSQSTYVTADKTAASTNIDLNGDGRADESRAVIRNADGSTSTTLSTFAATGQLGSRSFVTTSDDGLSTVQTTDLDGNGSTDVSKTVDLTLNADGSATTTIRNYSSTGALLNQEFATTSADGLAKNTLWDAKGTGVINRSVYETTSLSADGSTTNIVTFMKAGNALESQTIAWTSADKLTRSVTEDINGDGKIDYKSETTTAANGVRTTTNSNLAADGVTVTGQSVVSSYLDLWTLAYRYGANGVFTGYSAFSKWIDSYGNTVQSFREYVGTTLKEQALVTTSGNGLTKTTQWDLTGSGTYTQHETEATTLNTDGSTTTTISRYILNVLASRETTTTSANGLLTTENRDDDGNGSIDQSRTTGTVINADGTETQTVISTKAGGILLSQSMSTLSADGRTVTASEDTDGINGIDRVRTDSVVTLADGSTVDTERTTDLSGKLKSLETTTTSGDDRIVTSNRDADGNGTVDQTEVSTAYADGSGSVLITGFAGAAKNNQTITFNSADRLTSTTAWDVAGDGTFERKSVTLNTVNADGSLQQVTSSYSATIATSTDTNTLLAALQNAANGTLLSKRTITTTADGKSRTVLEDMNGDGVVDRTIVSTTDIAGAVTTMTTNTAEGRKVGYVPQSAPIWNAIYGGSAILTSTVSADGLTETIRADYDGDGVQEYTEVIARQIDGSTVSSIVETGVWAATGTKTISADGMTAVLVKIADPGSGGSSGKGGLLVFGTTVSAFVTRIDGTIEKTTASLDIYGQAWAGSIEVYSASGLNVSTQYIDQTAAPAWFAGNTILANASAAAIMGTEAGDFLLGTAYADRIFWPWRRRLDFWRRRQRLPVRRRRRGRDLRRRRQ